MAWFKYRGKVAPVSTAWNGASVSPHREVLKSLYAWEWRTRGYDLYPAPVALEPAFLPFDPQVAAGQWNDTPQPPCRADPGQLCHFSLLMPVEAGFPSSRRDASAQSVTPAQLLNCLSSLRSLQHPLSLEIIATATAIRYQIGCSDQDGPAVMEAMAGQFPLAQLEPGPDVLLAALQNLEGESFGQCIVDLGLREAVYRPLPFEDGFDPDPHDALLAALGRLNEDEVAGIQLLLAPARGDWGRELGRFLEYFDGDGDQAGEHRVKALERKLSGPLWCGALKAFAFASSPHAGQSSSQAVKRCFGVAAALEDESSPKGRAALSNRLLVLDDSGYEADQDGEENPHFWDLLARRSRRSGMLLGAAEIAALWHPPSPSLQHPRLLRYSAGGRELPDYLRDVEGAGLGTLDSGGNSASEPTLVLWPDAFRNRHAYLLGATRMGKSTLLGNLIAQDLLAGQGLCLIDPHGDLAMDVLRAIPPHREQDVLFVDLSDTAFPVSLGLLQAHDEWEERLLVSDLLSILHRIFASSWGDRLEHILRHALLTLMADNGPDAPAHTLRDIRPLLAEEAYREDLLERLRESDLLSFWRSEFLGYSSSAFAPIYNKLGLLLSSPVVRNIVAGRESKLDPVQIIRERRVLIVNLAGSLIGQDNAHFLGALLVSKIQLAAMQGLRLGQTQRVPFTLYVDEFQNFVVSSFQTILSEAGKAGLSLVMANQFLEQLSESLQSAILSNVGTLVSFRVSAPSGRRLEGEFGGLFGANELTDLERGQAVVRLGKAGDSFALRTFTPVEPDEVGAVLGASQRIVTATRREVCRPREDVEAELVEDEARLQELRAAWQAEQDRKKEEAKQQASKPRTGKSKTQPHAETGAAETEAKAPNPDRPKTKAQSEPKPQSEPKTAESQERTAPSRASASYENDARADNAHVPPSAPESPEVDTEARPEAGKPTPNVADPTEGSSGVNSSTDPDPFGDDPVVAEPPFSNSGPTNSPPPKPSSTSPSVPLFFGLRDPEVQPTSGEKAESPPLSGEQEDESNS